MTRTSSARPPRAGHAAALLLALVIGSAGAARAADTPLDKQVAVLVRAMSFDRGLKARVGQRLDVLVLYARDDVASAEMATSVKSAFDLLAGMSVQGAPLAAQSIGIVDAAGLQQALKSRDFDAVYVCSGLDDLIAPLRRETASLGVLSIASSSANVAAGLSLGLDLSGPKPTLVVNLAQARAERVDFASTMLNLARVIR